MKVPLRRLRLSPAAGVPRPSYCVFHFCTSASTGHHKPLRHWALGSADSAWQPVAKQENSPFLFSVSAFTTGMPKCAARVLRERAESHRWAPSPIAVCANGAPGPVQCTCANAHSGTVDTAQSSHRPVPLTACALLLGQDCHAHLSPQEGWSPLEMFIAQTARPCTGMPKAISIL